MSLKMLFREKRKGIKVNGAIYYKTAGWVLSWTNELAVGTSHKDHMTSALPILILYCLRRQAHTSMLLMRHRSK